jgi:tRNA-specific 2-thiouridylase
MPVGDYSKDQIREIAAELKLPVANKPDSQEICFVPDNDYAGYIANYLQESASAGAMASVPCLSGLFELPQSSMHVSRMKENPSCYTGLLPGNFINSSGEVIGKHKGLIHYTVGQRKGLGIAVGQPVFVVELRPETNEVVLGNSQEVFSDRLTANRLNFMAVGDLEGELEAEAKIRYSHKGSGCTIKRTGKDEVLCIFHEPQRAITPGQAVVFYQGDYVIGGGTIVR